MTSAKIELSATPLRDWPPQTFMAAAKRAARLWTYHPAFSPANGGLFSDPEDRADEIAMRVLEYLKKKPANDKIDQVSFFYQIAQYCKNGIIQDSYSIPLQTEGVDHDAEEIDRLIEIADQQQHGEAEEETQRHEQLQDLMLKIGITVRDFALFDTTSADWIEATGLSERHHRAAKSERKNEILAKIKTLNLKEDLAALMPVLRSSIFQQI